MHLLLGVQAGNRLFGKVLLGFFEREGVGMPAVERAHRRVKNRINERVATAILPVAQPAQRQSLALCSTAQAAFTC